MTDHDLPLPEVFEGTLDDEGLSQLACAVTAGTSGLEVRVKAATHTMDSRPRSLGDALASLREGRAMGVQLRYVHLGVPYVDTLMALESGRFRLVRMADLLCPAAPDPPSRSSA